MPPENPPGDFNDFKGDDFVKVIRNGMKKFKSNVFDSRVTWLVLEFL